MRSRDIGVYDTTRNRRTYSYTREHGHMPARTYLVDSLPIYPPTNLPAATQYETRDAIYEGWMRSHVKNDRRNRIARFRNVVSIISDAINRHDTSG